MSRSVDEKIAKMTLDNQSFISKVKETIAHFGQLNNATKNVSSMNVAPAEAGIRGLTAAVTGASTGFNGLAVIAATALSNITNRAVNAGLSFSQAFLSKPIKDGFNEYELKMKSIQTILSNTQGKSSLEDVKKTLGELNTYADQTIYSFADMTSNIGTFTAAGVGLKDSATAIKGIANLAAASGSNSQQASTAMYQLSQALATGSVKLQDWNSVVNAGMGGKLFQNALKKTAKEMGVNIDQSKSFRDSLKDGWLTSEVLLKTLTKFSKDQSMLEAATKVRTFTQLVDTAKEAIGSGWATSWEYLIGDFEEAGAMWSEAAKGIGVIVDGMAEARNNLIKAFVDLGGRAKIIDVVKNSFNALVGVSRLVKDAFHAIFPPLTAQKLFEIASAVADFSKKLIPAGKNAERLSRIFKGVFAAFSIVIQVAKKVGRALLNLIPKGTGGGILELIAKIGDMLVSFDKSMKAGNALTDVLDGMGDVFLTIGGKIGQAAEKVIDFASKGKEHFKSFYNTVVPYLQKAWDWINKFVASISTKDVVSFGLLTTLIAALKKLYDTSKSFSSTIDKLKEFFSSFTDKFDNALSIIDALKDSLKAFTTSIKVASLVGIAVALTLIAGSLKLLSTIDGEDMAKSLGALGASLAGLVIALQAIGTANITSAGTMKAVGVLISLGISMGMIVDAVKTLGDIDDDKLAKGLGSVVAILAIMTSSMAVMGKTMGDKKLGVGGFALLGFAKFITKMAKAVELMAGIDTDNLIKSITAMGAILLEMAAFLKVVDGAKFSPVSAASLIVTVKAIEMMADITKDIAKIDTKVLIKGLTVIAVILDEIGAFARATKGNNLISASLGMVAIAGALTLMIPPLTILGHMPFKVLAKGLTAMTVALKVVASTLKLANNTLSGAASIAVAAAAINLLVIPISALGALPMKNITKALIALAGAFTIMGAAAYLIGPAQSLALLAFSAALTAMGAAVALTGVGLVAFATSLTILGEITGFTAKRIIHNFGLMVDEITKIIPKIVKMMTTFVVALVEGLVDAAPKLLEAGFNLIINLIEVMAEKVPDVVNVAVDLIVAFAEAIGENAERLLDAAIKLVVDLLNGLANAIRDNKDLIVSAVLNIFEVILEVIITALAAIVDTFFGWIPGVGDAAKGLGDAASTKLREAFNIDTTTDIGSKGADGFNKGITGKKEEAGSAGNLLAEEAKKGANGVSFEPTGKKGASEYVKGIDGTKSKSNAAGKKVAEEARHGAGGVPLTGEGKNAGQQYVEGLTGKSLLSKNSGKKVAEEARKGAGGVPLRNEGKNAGQQYVDNLNSKSGKSRSAGQNIGKSAKSGVGGVNLRREGTNAGNQYTTSLGSRSGMARSKGYNLGSSAKSGAGSVSLYNSGVNAGQGFANGLSSRTWTVSSVASGLADTARSALRGILRIASPSRALREDGNYTADGFILGMEDKAKKVGSTAKSIGQSAIDAMRSTASIMSDTILENLDSQPKITPVLDMSKFDTKSLSDNMHVTSDLPRTTRPYVSVLEKAEPSAGDSYNYTINVTANGDLPDSTIKRMAKKIDREIKNINDSKKLARGGEVTF